MLTISAEHDVDAVLQLIVDRGRHLVGARYGALGVPSPDGSHLERFYHAGMTDEEVALIGPFPTGRGVLGIMLTEGRALRVADVAAHPRAVGLPPHHPPIDTLLGVPIAYQGTILGDLYVANRLDGAPFTEDDQRLLKMLCRPAALAIHNARLLERLAASEQAYRFLTEGAPDFVFALSADGVLEYANPMAREVTGRPPDELVGLPLRDLFVLDDRPFVDLTLEALRGGARQSAFSGTVATPDRGLHHLDVSMVPASAERRGFYGIARDITTQTAMAREVAERTSELLSTREERERLRELVSLVMQAQEAERARIAGDLHDTTVQTLTAIGRRLRSLGSAEDAGSDSLRRELTDLGDAALAEAEEVRRLSRNLRPSVLDHLGLDAALAHLVSEMSSDELDVQLTTQGASGRLDELHRTTLFRIAQEALTNVRRHSGARHASVELTVEPEEAVLVVRDDGAGFQVAEVDHAGSPRPHLGLAGMRERAAMMGGRLEVASSPEGTRVTARLPLDA